MLRAWTIVLSLITLNALSASVLADDPPVKTSASVEFVPAGQPPQPAPPAPPPQRPPPPPKRDDIVDYPRVFDQMKETQDERAQLETRRELTRLEDLRILDNIRKLREQRDALAPSTPEFDAANGAFEQAKRDRDNLMKVRQAEFERDSKAQMARIFKKVEAAVAEVAERRKLTLPAIDAPAIPDDLDPITSPRLREMIFRRFIARPKDAPDLTAEAIQLLDERYLANADVQLPNPTDK